MVRRSSPALPESIMTNLRPTCVYTPEGKTRRLRLTKGESQLS